MPDNRVPVHTPLIKTTQPSQPRTTRLLRPRCILIHIAMRDGTRMRTRQDAERRPAQLVCEEDGVAVRCIVVRRRLYWPTTPDGLAGDGELWDWWCWWCQMCWGWLLEGCCHGGLVSLWIGLNTAGGWWLGMSRGWSVVVNRLVLEDGMVARLQQC